MKRIFIFFIVVLIFSGCKTSVDQSELKLPSDSLFNFIIISDHGRNGYFNQKVVADMMAGVADSCSIRFIVTGGDNFQISGVQSVQDPLWMASFENIFTHPSLHVEWYPALGNHDHGGNIQAQIDYSNISRRWKMPGSYYTLVKSRGGVSVRLLILDTYSLVEGYGDPGPKYPLENAQKQVTWVDSVLTASKEDWVVVVGHHPVFSAHPTRHNTAELVEYLNPVLNKHNVDFYIGAHDHIFQHLKDKNSNIDYFVNTAASSVRPAASNEMTVFTASSPGFSICSASKTSLSISFINIEGKVLYQYTRDKKQYN
ncbi:MAG: metallophosphoesterase [Bacteroidales bacterium]|nr:metallophosphoesterase [Bacteroidales bacterium]